jgi:hypothetical protein
LDLYCIIAIILGRLLKEKVRLTGGGSDGDEERRRGS